MARTANDQPTTIEVAPPVERLARRRRARLALVGLAMLGLPGLLPFVQGVDAAQGTFVSQCPGATYTVVRGDSWSLIAARQQVTMASLLTANRATTSTWLFPGNVLCLPGATTTTAPAATTPMAVPSVSEPLRWPTTAGQIAPVARPKL